MTNTPEKTARSFEQQAQVQREQFEMIRAQQESIDSLKQMLALSVLKNPLYNPL